VKRNVFNCLLNEASEVDCMLIGLLIYKRYAL